jgi:hypothetical protein
MITKNCGGIIDGGARGEIVSMDTSGRTLWGRRALLKVRKGVKLA